MKTSFLLLLIISFISASGYSQQSGRVKDIVKEPGKPAQTEMLMNNREFVFHARMAIPSHGSSVDLTTNQNFVRFQPDMIESYMPFFGRAYSGVGYGGDAGLHFKGQPEVFEVRTKSRNYQVTAKVKGSNDNFRLFLTVSPDGSATLTISSNNRESITYRGEVREERSEK